MDLLELYGMFLIHLRIFIYLFSSFRCFGDWVWIVYKDFLIIWVFLMFFYDFSSVLLGVYKKFVIYFSEIIAFYPTLSIFFRFIEDFFWFSESFLWTLKDFCEVFEVLWDLFGPYRYVLDSVLDFDVSLSGLFGAIRDWFRSFIKIFFYCWVFLSFF